ncbi:YlzJ-like family protein [Paenibacillus sp. GCM10027626]|uniref:YlzJ-like family protein n=1 Tax=Paenibacillus sp. GCM10027626 TaxID=3273411 RepID=UPI003641242A
MTIYTNVPLEVVLNGMNEQPGPFVDIDIAGIRMQIVPVSPGIGRIVRLLECPLDTYLKPEYTPGTLIAYGNKGE